MILKNYLRKNIFKTFIVSFAILLAIFFAQQLIIAFTQVSRGNIPPGFILKYIALNMPAMMQYFLPFALFLGILFTFIRMYHNQEIIVMFACGIKYRTIFRSFMPLAVAVVIIGIINSLWISPMLLTESRNQVQYFKTNPTFSLIKPGSFTQIPGTDYILFVNSIDKNLAHDMYVFSFKTGNHIQFIHSSTGIIQVVNGQRQIVLKDGVLFSKSLTDNFYQQVVLTLPQLHRSQAIYDACVARQEAVHSDSNTKNNANVSSNLSTHSSNNASTNNPDAILVTAAQCQALLHTKQLVEQTPTTASQVRLASFTPGALTLQANQSLSNDTLGSEATITDIADVTATMPSTHSASKKVASDSVVATATATTATPLTAKQKFQLALQQAKQQGVQTPKGTLLFSSQDFSFAVLNQLLNPDSTTTNTVKGNSGNPTTRTNSNAIFNNGTNKSLLPTSSANTPDPSNNIYKIEFATLTIRLDLVQADDAASKFKYQTVSQLLESDNHFAKIEVVVRIINALSVFMLAILAFTFGKVNPRQGRNSNVIIAISLYFIYLLIFQSLMSVINKGAVIDKVLLIFIVTNIAYLCLIYVLTTERPAVKNSRSVDWIRNFFGVQ